MLSFKPAFSFSSCNFNNKLFSSSSISALRVVLPAYLRLLIFLPEILIPAYASSSPQFMIMKSLNMALQGFCFFFNSWIPLFCITKCFIFIGAFYLFTRASLVAQTVKQETWVRFLGREEPLEKEMATHSSTLAWKIPWTEEPDRLQSMGSQRVGHD